MKAILIVLLIAVLLPSLALCSSSFKCQNVINTYNQYVNIGQFEKAANLTFTEDVRYVIPGPSAGCPYCGVYNGKKAVVSLFVNGFLGHFTIVNPLVNLRQVDTGSDVSKSPMLLNFNQESFVTKPSKTKGGVGRYFSVPVIHDFTFDTESCLITQMILFQDPYTVTKVFAGEPPTVAPVMPFCLFSSPPSTFFSNQNVSDFQVFPQEESISADAATKFIKGYYAAVMKENGTLSLPTASKLFLSLDYTIPQAMGSMIVPGDPSVLPFAGVFMGVEQIVQGHNLRRKLAREESPLKSQGGATWVVDGGSVVVKYKLRGVATATERVYTSDAVDYFQVLPTGKNGDIRIGRMTRFFDTYNVTMALQGK